ncbi:MAG: hypothetical protein GY708_08250 [Actinomycetia bacterium]|nr:hypothetical protein [Actinomycetes bacterium]MCP4963430.1 hypothetical protein [Actinomycetes bacterium]
MQIILAVALVAALALAASGFANSGSPSVPGAAGEPELPTLGPVRLIAKTYTGTGNANCTRGTNITDPVQCVDQSIKAHTDFDIDAGTTIECTATNGFVIDTLTTCTFNNGGVVSLKMDVTYPGDASTNLPCEGTLFATVTLTNSVGDTSTIQIQKQNNETGACI